MNASMPAGDTQNLASTDNEPELMVQFRDVSKHFGDLTVLNHLDLDVRTGEKVAIIGPSGSGKSTLLRALMTLEDIDEGVIMVDDQPLTHMPDASGNLVRANARHLRRVRSAHAKWRRHCARGAGAAQQSLRDDSLQRRRDLHRRHPHVGQARRRTRRVVRVERGQHEVTGE